MKALVIAGGEVPPALLRRELADADFVVCADSGAERIQGSGRLPDLLVGDMDSVSPALLESLETSGVETLRVAAEKDETDAELAVDEAIRRGASEIVLLGALGGRVDHMLGNLMLLVRTAKKNVKSVAMDENCSIFAATGEIEIMGSIGDTVSLLPAGSGVSVRYLDGFRYGPKDPPLKLPIDSPVGVSNVLTAERANALITGWAYVFQYYHIS